MTGANDDPRSAHDPADRADPRDRAERWTRLSNRLLIIAAVWGVLMITVGVFLLRFAALRPIVSALFVIYLVYFVVTYWAYRRARKLKSRASRSVLPSS